MAHLQRIGNFIVTKVKTQRFINLAVSNLYSKRLLHITNVHNGYVYKKWYAPMLIEFQRRVDELKYKELYPNELYPAPVRSQFLEWNYDAEIYAVGKRLNEEFSEQLLREAVTDSSYIFQETQKLEEAGMVKTELNLRSNDDLAKEGEELIKDFSLMYLRSTCHLLPEEGIQSLKDYLCSTEVLGKISEQLGFKDLILTKEYPPSTETYAKCFKALVGCLNSSSGLERCQLFIKDFVIVQLIGKDLWDIWKIEDPFHVLNGILKRNGRGEAEPRLIGDLGRNTIESVFYIGIYDASKKLIGKGYGETINTGVKVAAYDALSVLFGQTNARPPLPLQDKNISQWLKTEPNPSLNEWTDSRTN